MGFIRARIAHADNQTAASAGSAGRAGRSGASGGGGVAERTHFVKGYFNDSLTDELVRRRRFQPALFVDLDCDLYISTIQACDLRPCPPQPPPLTLLTMSPLRSQALRWLLRHRLIVPSTIVRYDDWQVRACFLACSVW